MYQLQTKQLDLQQLPFLANTVHLVKRNGLNHQEKTLQKLQANKANMPLIPRVKGQHITRNKSEHDDLQ